MCRVHIVLQELQAVTMMLQRMAFNISGKVVALHLHNSTAKAYLCNHGGTVSLFFPDWPAGYSISTDSIWLTSMVLLLFQHTFLSISKWRLIICPRVRCFQCGIFSLRWLKQCFTFGVFQRWICWHPPIPLNVRIITAWKLHYLLEPWG